MQRDDSFTCGRQAGVVRLSMGDMSEAMASLVDRTGADVRHLRQEPVFLQLVGVVHAIPSENKKEPNRQCVCGDMFSR